MNSHNSEEGMSALSKSLERVRLSGDYPHCSGSLRDDHRCNRDLCEHIQRIAGDSADGGGTGSAAVPDMATLLVNVFEEIQRVEGLADPPVALHFSRVSDAHIVRGREEPAGNHCNRGSGTSPIHPVGRPGDEEGAEVSNLLTVWEVRVAVRKPAPIQGTFSTVPIANMWGAIARPSINQICQYIRDRGWQVQSKQLVRMESDRVSAEKRLVEIAHNGSLELHRNIATALPFCSAVASKTNVYFRAMVKLMFLWSYDPSWLSATCVVECTALVIF